MFKWAYLISVALLVGCGDAPQSQVARTSASAPRGDSALSPTQWVFLDPEEILRRSKELKAHQLILLGNPRLQYRVVPDDPFPIQDYWRWERQEQPPWRVAPSDR